MMEVPNESSGKDFSKSQFVKLGLVTFFVTATFVSVICMSGLFGKVSHPLAFETALELQKSIAEFQKEYGRYPCFDSEFDTDLQSDHDLMDVILAATYTQRKASGNPNGVVFFTENQAKPMKGGGFRKGLQVESGGRGVLWDPWGNFFRVRIDSNHDEQVGNPAREGESIRESILVWSAGPDGDFMTWEDNVKTW